MSNVELPSSVEQLGTSNHKATLEHYSGVDNRGGVTRNKDEKISRIAETVVSDRQPVKDIIRNVIEKDPLIRNSAEQIEAEVTTGFGKGTGDIHGHRPASTSLFRLRPIALRQGK
jgi:hypothetical protein